MPNRESGFTLLELLISVSIFALLMTVLFGGLQLGSRQVTRMNAELERSGQIALVQNFLRAQVGDALPLATGPEDAKTVQFRGRPESLDLVSVAPQSVVTGGLQVLSIKATAAGDVMAAWRPLRENPDEPNAPRTTVLLRGVRGLRFMYFGRPSASAPPEWQESWEDMDRLPQLVRLSVAFADGARMPDLAVALRLAAIPKDRIDAIP